MSSPVVVAAEWQALGLRFSFLTKKLTSLVATGVPGMAGP